MAHEDGQFDDAPEDDTGPIQVSNPSTVDAPTVAPASVIDARQGASYIDEDGLLEWSEPEDEDSYDSDQVLGDDDNDYENRVEDEDWDIAERGMHYSTFQSSSLFTIEKTLPSNIIG